MRLPQFLKCISIIAFAQNASASGALMFLRTNPCNPVKVLAAMHVTGDRMLDLMAELQTANHPAFQALTDHLLAISQEDRAGIEALVNDTGDVLLLQDAPAFQKVDPGLRELVKVGQNLRKQGTQKNHDLAVVEPAMMVFIFDYLGTGRRSLADAQALGRELEEYVHTFWDETSEHLGRHATNMFFTRAAQYPWLHQVDTGQTQNRRNQ